MAKLDVSKLAERLEQLNKGGGNNGGGTSFSYIKLEDGRNVVRILPPKGDNDFAEEVFVHYGVGKSEENKNGTMVVCPTTKGEKEACPVCEYVKELRKLKKKDNDRYDKEARSLGRKKRVYFNAISEDTDLEDFEKREVEVDGKKVEKWFSISENKEMSPVRILGTGIGIFKDVLSFIVDPEYGDITDPKTGLDLIITKSGTGFNTNYDVKTKRKESEVEFEHWEECLNDLTVLSNVSRDYDALSALLTGEEPEPKDDDEDEDEEDTSTDSTDEGTDEEDDNLQDEIANAIKRRKNK